MIRKLTTDPAHVAANPTPVVLKKHAQPRKRSLLVNRVPKGVAYGVPNKTSGENSGHGPAFSGSGFVPDFASEHGIATFAPACATGLELGSNVGVPGKEGMMPPPGMRHRVAFTAEGGTGGAGSFNTSIAQPKEIS